MIEKAKIPALAECLDDIGLAQALRDQGSVLIKVNEKILKIAPPDYLKRLINDKIRET